MPTVQPSTMKSSLSSRARGGGDAVIHLVRTPSAPHPPTPTPLPFPPSPPHTHTPPPPLKSRLGLVLTLHATGTSWVSSLVLMSLPSLVVSLLCEFSPEYSSPWSTTASPNLEVLICLSSGLVIGCLVRRLPVLMYVHTDTAQFSISSAPVS